MIYLDNAATSWPVYAATDMALRNAANLGRGGHRFSRQAAKMILEARETVASFFSEHLPDELFSIAARGGLHCSPQAHKALGTPEQGTRISPEFFNSPAEVDQLTEAVSKLNIRSKR